jgi:hypothetical protein
VHSDLPVQATVESLQWRVLDSFVPAVHWHSFAAGISQSVDWRCAVLARLRLRNVAAGANALWNVAAGMDASAETDRAFIAGEQPVWRRTLSHGKAKLVAHAEQMRLC